MVTTQKAQNISSPITAHRVFLLHLESMRLLGEENRCNGQSQQKTERKAARSQHSGVRRLRWTVLLLALLIAASVCCARAQSTMGSILGTVQDASGAVIPGATVTVKSLDQDLTRTATTNDSGDFLVENLKAGHYSIAVEHTGFAKSVVANAQLDARQALRVPVTMAIAEQSTEVVVQASGYQIKTEDATLSDSKDNIQFTQLPLNDRATTTSPLGSLEVSSNVQQDSSGNIALGGATASMVNFSVDGISTSNVRQNGALQDAYPSLEGMTVFLEAGAARLLALRRCYSL